MENNNRLILLCGIPGSGKSTYALERFKSDNNVILISRDKIRMLLFGYNENNIKEYYKKDNFQTLENRVSEYQHELILHAVNSNKTVIVDNTNLKLSHIKKFFIYDIKTDLYIFKDSLDVKECIRRDSKRINKVGSDKILLKKQQFDMLLKNLQIEELIKDSFEKSEHKFFTIFNYNFGEHFFKYIPNKRLPNCIIVDVDNTIANNNHRNPYDYKNVLNDKPINNIVKLITTLKESYNYKIVICTGRNKYAETDTKIWLQKYKIYYDDFYIREENDNRKDYIVKAIMWKKIIEKYNVNFMIDDRRQVIDHARSLGFTVLDVANNTF